MIQSQFYPDDTTLSVPPQGFTLTKSINEISYGSNIDDPLRPYTMGYIPYEDYPKFLDLTKVTPVYSQGTENKIVLESSTIPSNMPWGYVARTDNVFENYSRSLFIYRDNDVWIPQLQLTNEGVVIGAVRMINAGYLATYTVTNYIRYQVGISLTYDDATAGNGTHVYLESTIQDFLDFCNGDATLDFVYNNSQYNISIDDFDERGYAVTRNPEDTGNILIAICGPQWLDRGSGNGQGGVAQIVPYIAVPTEEGIHYEAFTGFPGGNIDIRINLYTGNQPMEIYMNTAAGAYGFTRLYGASGTLNYSDTLSWARAYNTQEWHYIPQLNMFRGFSGGNAFRLVPIFPPKQLKTLIELRLKTIKSLTAYGNYAPANHIYDTDINTNKYDTSNVPTGDVLNGTYNEIVAELRPWQLWQVDITVNDFNPDDIPPYNPTPGGDDSSGDNITPYNFVNTPLGAANNFITLYSLNTAQVADFGRRMWASLSDDAFWESVGTVFLNDFSINPADMMKYFVSLRYFPFDLSIVHSSQTWGIYIGRSSYPIQPSIGTELPHRITMNLVQLDGGSVFVPNNYNDFRDYEPYTKVSVTVPFCGVLELTPSEVVGKNLYLDYVIDLQTGTIKATVSVQSNTFFIVGSLSGVCGSQIPLTANNNIEFLQRIANVGSSIINSSSSAGNTADTVAGLTGSGAIGAVAGGVVMGANAVGSMLSLPPITVHKQGNATGFANYGGSSQAYLTVQRQQYIVPDNYGHSVGYATAFSSVLSSLSGFTVCSNVDLSGFLCHEDERSEIKALLESGVYL